MLRSQFRNACPAQHRRAEEAHAGPGSCTEGEEREGQRPGDIESESNLMNESESNRNLLTTTEYEVDSSTSNKRLFNR